MVSTTWWPVEAGCCATDWFATPVLAEALARKRMSLASFARLDVGAVVRCFLCDRNVMRMVLPNRRGRDLDEFAIPPQFVNRPCSHVTHACSQSTDQLVQIIAQRSFERHTTFDTLRDKLACLSAFLSVPVATSFHHRAHGTHPPIGFEGSTLVQDDLSRTLGQACKQAADHHGAGTGRDRFCYVAAEADPSVSDDWYVSFVCHLSRFQDG